MFYIWHTLIIAVFLTVGYYLGFEHGKRQSKVKKTISKS